MEAFSFRSPRRSKPNSNALSSPISHIYSSSLDSFYSAPTSPCTTPVASSETNSDTDEFEFKSTPYSMNSSHYSKHQPPVMAFADELFHDNQLLPLKLPPRLQCPSPPPPPPQKPRGTPIWKITLSALGFNNKEFDPFMAAMKRIRKEGKRGHSRTHEGSKKKVRKDNIIPFLGALKGKGGVKYKVNDHTGGVRGLKDGSEQHGDDFNARMVDIKEMRNRSLTRYKRSHATFLSCFGFGPR